VDKYSKSTGDIDRPASDWLDIGDEGKTARDFPPRCSAGPQCSSLEALMMVEVCVPRAEMLPLSSSILCAVSLKENHYGVPDPCVPSTPSNYLAR
jgi:hypothetical protein